MQKIHVYLIGTKCFMSFSGHCYLRICFRNNYQHQNPQNFAVAWKDSKTIYNKSCCIFFGGLECVCHSFTCVTRWSTAIFCVCIFERCLDSNPEICRCKQTLYKLCPHLSFLATHLPYLATHLLNHLVLI